jgi:hypothetical protein
MPLLGATGCKIYRTEQNRAGIERVLGGPASGQVLPTAVVGTSGGVASVTLLTP